VFGEDDAREQIDGGLQAFIDRRQGIQVFDTAAT
jgi:hypothetical protein